MKIIMHETEIELLSAFLGQSSAYFEFGMGGSTCLAARLVRQRVHAIDSSADWVEKVRQEIGTSDKEIRISTVDIGPTGNWGNPVGRSHAALFPDYSLSITRTGFVDYDLCLVDGRFRVACFLQALSTLRADAVIAIHDYTVRPAYHVVEEFARPVAGANQLRMFVRRPGIDMNRLRAVLDRHRDNPA